MLESRIVRLRKQDPALAEEARAASRIVEQIRAGNRAAETEMVRRYSQGLGYLLARRIGDAERARDLLQETFYIAIKKLRRTPLDNPERLAGHLRGIAIRVAMNASRKRKREPYPMDYEALARIPDRTSRQFEHIAEAQTQVVIRRLLADLPVERDREILYRYYVDEQDKAQICRALGLDSLHFNRVLFRAKARFRKLLEQSGESTDL